ncbi:hypothetical protein JB92DRAFT_3098326 [Gautieria morchelliformis]|nr:hypothetical protein JB92DRAFT_3098326 [Gautieria morchelliformis]
MFQLCQTLVALKQVLTDERPGPSLFFEGNSSTVTVLTMPPPSIPNIVVQPARHTGVIPTISDYDAEKAARIVERKKHLTSAPRLAVDPMVWWPCQLTHGRPVVSRTPGGSALISKSSDLLPCSSSPTSSGKGGGGMCSPCLPLLFPTSPSSPSTITLTRSPFISDYDAEETVRRSDKKTGKVREDPKTLGFLHPLVLPYLEEEEVEESYS